MRVCLLAMNGCVHVLFFCTCGTLSLALASFLACYIDIFVFAPSRIVCLTYCKFSPSQPAVAFAIREQLYEVNILSRILRVLVLYAFGGSWEQVFSFVSLSDCNSECCFSKRKQNKQKGSQRKRTYATQVWISPPRFLLLLFIVKCMKLMICPCPSLPSHSKAGGTGVDLMKLYGFRSSVVR